MQARRNLIGAVGLLALGVTLAYTLLSLRNGGGPPADAAEMPIGIPSQAIVETGSSGWEDLTFVEKLRIGELYASEFRGPWMRLTIDGTEIPGESPVASLGREGTIDCYGFDHNLYIPHDEKTGRQTDRRVHGLVNIIKRHDRASVLLYKALCQNEPVNTVELMFFRPAAGGSGAEERYLTILLENAYVFGIKSAYPNLERVSFRYQWIRWTYETEGITHRDFNS